MRQTISRRSHDYDARLLLPSRLFFTRAKSCFLHAAVLRVCWEKPCEGSGPVEILIKIRNNFSSRSRKSAPSYQRRPHFASTPSAVFSNGGAAGLEAQKKNSQGMRKVHSRFACFFFACSTLTGVRAVLEITGSRHLQSSVLSTLSTMTRRFRLAGS